MIWKYIIKIGCLSLLLPSAFACKYYFCLDAYQDHHFPSYMYINHTAIADEVFTNKEGSKYSTFQVLFDPAPSGGPKNLPKPGLSAIPAIPDPDTNIPSCLDAHTTSETFILDSGKSCILRFKFNPSQKESISENEAIPYVEAVKSGNFDAVNAQISVQAIDTLNVEQQATIKASDNSVTLVPGHSTVIKVTNISQVIANDIQVTIPETLDNDVKVTRSAGCDFLGPNHSNSQSATSCTITFTADKQLPAEEQFEPIDVQGSNTSELLLPVRVNQPDNYSVNIQVQPIARPGKYISLITVHNDSSFDLSGLSNTLNQYLPSGVLPITTGYDNLCGEELAKGASCQYAYEVEQGAYQRPGTGTGSIAYTINNQPTSQAVSIEIPKTTLEVSFGSANQVDPEDIPVPVGHSQTITVENTGNFATSDLKITPDSKAATWFQLKSSNCTPVLLPGGKPCQQTYQASAPHGIPIDAGSLSITADNTEPQTFNLIPVNKHIDIEVDRATAAQHLGYTAIKLVNDSGENYQISHLKPGPTDPLNQSIETCDTKASNCEDDVRYQSTCITDTPSKPLLLQSGSSCYIWYKATHHTQIVPSEVLQWPVTFDVSVDQKNSSKTSAVDHFNFTVDASYNVSLYVAGNFYYAGSYPLRTINIAKWDGTKWSAVTSDTQYHSPITSLQLFHGNLYAAGVFQMIDNLPSSQHIAQWNGDTWSTLSTKNMLLPKMYSMLSLAGIGNDLYVGGMSSTSPGAMLAQWHLGTNGSGQWRALQNSSKVIAQRNIPYASALYNLNKELFVGGSFQAIGEQPSANVAGWVPNKDSSSIGSWDVFGTAAQRAVKGIVNSFTSLSSGKLYLGGYVSGGGNNYGIRYLDTQNNSWVPIPVSTNQQKILQNCLVTTLGSGNNNLYIGGIVSGIARQACLIAYNPVDNKISPMLDGSQGYLDGTIYSMLWTPQGIYIGGSFTQLSNDHTTAYRGVALLQQGKLHALGGGIGVSSSDPGGVYAMQLVPDLMISQIG